MSKTVNSLLSKLTSCSRFSTPIMMNLSYGDMLGQGKAVPNSYRGVIPALLPLLVDCRPQPSSPPRKRKVNNVGCFGRYPTPLKKSLLNRPFQVFEKGEIVEEPIRLGGSRAGLVMPLMSENKIHKMQKREKSPGLSNSLRKARQARPPEPPIAGISKKRNKLPTTFRRTYDRGDLPLCLKHQGTCNSIEWRISPGRLDYHHFLPIFFDGIREPFEPHCNIAIQGCIDLIIGNPPKCIPCIPQLIVAIKDALATRDTRIVSSLLKILQLFIKSHEYVAPALVPFFRQILPLFNLYISWNHSLGDQIEYSQQRRQNVGDLAVETLQLLEMYGGESAYPNIKYMIPTYESCRI